MTTKATAATTAINEYVNDLTNVVQRDYATKYAHWVLDPNNAQRPPDLFNNRALADLTRKAMWDAVEESAKTQTAPAA